MQNDMILGLGSYQLTTKERNGRGRVRWEDGVVDESTTCVADMKGKGFSDGETKLLQGVDGGGRGRVGVSIEGTRCGEAPIMVGKL